MPGNARVAVLAWVSHRIQILWSEWAVQSPQTLEQPESLVSECPRVLKGGRSENQQCTETGRYSWYQSAYGQRVPWRSENKDGAEGLERGADSPVVFSSFCHLDMTWSLVDTWASRSRTSVCSAGREGGYQWPIVQGRWIWALRTEQDIHPQEYLNR